VPNVDTDNQLVIHRPRHSPISSKYGRQVPTEKERKLQCVHRGVIQDSLLLGNDAASIGNPFPAFRANVLP
jgi:hypothetical protein